MLISATIAFLLIYLGGSKKSLIPGRLQALVEMFYSFIAEMIKDTIGNAGRPFFPMVFALFMFVLFNNVIGLTPASHTATAYISVTLTLAVFVMTTVTIVGFTRHGLGFFKLFVPDGVPLLMVPIIFPVEVFSYLVRVVSLSVRLFASMFAGHIMMKIFASFIVVFGIVGGLGLFVDIALYPFKLFVSFIQAYIFAILTCLYLNDAVNLH